VVVLAVLWPVLVTALFSVLLGIELQLLRENTSLIPDLRVVMVDSLVVLWSCVFGCALAQWLPIGLAAPAALSVVYAWLVLPFTIGPLWLRQLTGQWSDCCMSEDELSLKSLQAVVVLSLCLTVGSGLVIVARTVKWDFLLVGSLVLVTGIGVLVPPRIIDRGKMDPVVPRSSGLVCSDSGVHVCVWKEHSRQLTRAMAWFAEKNQELSRIGIRLPAELTERPVDQTGAVLGTFGVSSVDMGDRLGSSLAYAYSPKLSSACLRRWEGVPLDSRSVILPRSTMIARSWMAIRLTEPSAKATGGDQNPDGGQNRYEAAARRIGNSPLALQVKWFNSVVRAAETCDAAQIVAPA
jgi:hypothetical protein